MMTRLLVRSVTCRLRCFPFPTPLKIKATTNTINRSTNQGTSIHPGIEHSPILCSAGQVDFLAGQVTFEAYFTRNNSSSNEIIN